ETIAPGPGHLPGELLLDLALARGAALERAGAAGGVLVARADEPVLLQLALQGEAADAQELGGLALVALGGLERAVDRATLEVGDRFADVARGIDGVPGPGGGADGTALEHGGGQVLEA